MNATYPTEPGESSAGQPGSVWGPPDASPVTPARAATPPADPYAGWAAGPHDLIPLLPRGTALFESIPAPAVVIDALSPAIGDGFVLIRRPEAVGVILVKDGELFEEYAFEGGSRVDGGEALRQIARWTDATVSAHRFDPTVVAIAPVLFRGTRCYEDLRLEWTDWRGLLADLRSRDGLFAVELDTPAGRGVTLIVNGRQVATYTDTHPELGEEGLVDLLAATRKGTIWVRREGGGEAFAMSAGPQLPPAATVPADEPGTAGPVDALDQEPSAEGTDWSTPPPWRAEGVGDFAPQPYPPEPLPEPPGDPFAEFSTEDEQEAPAPPRWGDPEADGYPNAPRAAFPPPPSVPVAPIATALKQVARLRLQRSSPRVEAMVDEAAARDLALDTLLDEIRGLVIRGVMQSTLDQVVDEMAAFAAPPPA
jgi:hypothetical protein